MKVQLSLLKLAKITNLISLPLIVTLPLLKSKEINLSLLLLVIVSMWSVMAEWFYIPL